MHTAVDHEVCARDVRRVVRRQEQRRPRNLNRLACTAKREVISGRSEQAIQYRLERTKAAHGEVDHAPLLLLVRV